MFSGIPTVRVQYDCFIVPDFVSGGTLVSSVQQEKTHKEDDVRFYMGELILAVEHLHSVSTLSKGFTNEAP
jgi:serine/threonine protein kinase